MIEAIVQSKISQFPSVKTFMINQIRQAVNNIKNNINLIQTTPIIQLLLIIHINSQTPKTHKIKLFLRIQLRNIAQLITRHLPIS